MPVTRKALPTRTTTPTGKAAVKPGDADTDGQATEAAAGTSLASAFDDTPAAGGSNVPSGKYEAIIVKGAILDPKPNGAQSIQVLFEIADEGDEQGKKISAFYNILGPGGVKHQGVGYFKRDMAKLGFEDLKGADIKEALEELADEMVGCSITVKVGEYTNVYVNNVIENSEIIDGWKESRPNEAF